MAFTPDHKKPAGIAKSAWDDDRPNKGRIVDSSASVIEDRRKSGKPMFARDFIGGGSKAALKDALASDRMTAARKANAKRMVKK